jgi:hypothetical protein
MSQCEDAAKAAALGGSRGGGGCGLIGCMQTVLFSRSATLHAVRSVLSGLALLLFLFLLMFAEPH